MRQNLRYIFHFLIITQILLFGALSTGCGFKDDPFRSTQTQP
ncbi:hypothetical protein [uncultured Helicobacter sp.]|nr:hypothetical protein [uncultured Helicobacter sp.]